MAADQDTLDPSPVRRTLALSGRGEQREPRAAEARGSTADGIAADPSLPAGHPYPCRKESLWPVSARAVGHRPVHPPMPVTHTRGIVVTSFAARTIAALDPHQFSLSAERQLQRRRRATRGADRCKVKLGFEPSPGVLISRRLGPRAPAPTAGSSGRAPWRS